MGRIILDLHPVSFSEEDNEKVSAAFDNGTLAIDICNLIGNTDLGRKLKPNQPTEIHLMLQDPTRYSELSSFRQLCRKKNLPPLEHNTSYNLYDLRKRLSKLYFSPSEYPPPSDIHEAPDSIIFGRLRNYIKSASEIGGSPVVSVGCSNLNERRFKCKYWYRRQEHMSPPEYSTRRAYNLYSCTFSFTVEWNKYGYYIPLLRERDTVENLGCAWHCCNEEHDRNN